MKKSHSWGLLGILLLSFTTPENNCSSLFFFNEGSSFTMTNYNEEGKVTGSSTTIYTKLVKSPSGLSITAQQENFNKKGKSETKNEFTIMCQNGLLIFDMKSMMNSKELESIKDFEVTMEGNNLEMPSNMVIGSTLKDANVKFNVKTKDGMAMPMFNMSINITNRKIESKESVTTPAGTFECYKITQDIESKTMFTMKLKSTNWFSFEVGTVKTESAKESGKFMSRSELTAFKK